VVTADLDDAPRIAGAAELVAELGLVAVECYQLVARKALAAPPVRGRRLRLVDPLGVVASQRRKLLVAPGVQGGQQASSFDR
jgi:hypothetical protein